MIERLPAYQGRGWKPRKSRLENELNARIWSDHRVDSEWNDLRAVILSPPGPELAAIRDPRAAQFVRRVSPSRLRREFSELARAYRKLGIEVIQLNRGLLPRRLRTAPPNLMFMRDLFFNTREGAVLCRMASRVRAGEEKFIGAQLSALAVPVRCTVGGEGLFEGADALWLDSKTVLCGIGNRTNKNGIRELRTMLAEQGVRVVPVKMPNGVQHLLGLLQLVDKNLAVVRTRKLPAPLKRLLRLRGVRVIGIEETDEVVHRQAMNFVTVSRRKVVMAAGCPDMESTLRANGIRIAARVDVREALQRRRWDRVRNWNSRAGATVIENPIFIVGTERSGSNLLRVLLNELPGVCVPHPPHLMRDLTPRLAYYGDLKIDKNFRRLIRHAVELVRLHFAPWPFDLDTGKIFAAARERDLYSIYAAIYEQYRAHEGKKRWACKSTFMVQHVADILKHHKNPQFIHLVRDPRDVAVSARKSIFSHYHPYYVAGLWAREQRIALGWAAQLPSKSWLSLHYEDLIREPAKQMRRVCEFLGEPYSDELLKYFDKPAARELSKLSRSWENVGRPILADNSEKFRSELDPREISLIETLASEEMRRLDYPLSQRPLVPPPSVFAKLRYSLSEEWMFLRGEGLALLKDRNARLRLKKRAFLYSLRLQP